MKHVSVGVLLSFLVFSNAEAQHVKDIKGESVFSPSYAEAKGTWIDTAKLEITYDTLVTTADTLAFELIPGNLTDAPAILLPDKKFVVTPAQLSDAKEYRYSASVPIGYNTRSKPLEGDEVAYVIIKDQPKLGSHTVRISNKGGYLADQPFWIEIGANVDLAEQKLNNLFGGVFLYRRDWAKLNKYVWGSGTKDNKNRIASTANLAIAAGVYESKASTITLQNNSGFAISTYYDRSSLQTLPNSDVNIYTDTGALHVKNDVKNIGLFFSPQVRLTKGDANRDGIYLFFSVYTELIWQHITSELDYSEMVRRDTLVIKRNDPAFNTYIGKQASQEHDFFSHYDGIGFPIFAKAGDANLYVNPVFGVTNQPSTRDIEAALGLSNDNSGPRRDWNAFYLVQFRLSEERYGLSFSGEVRQLIGERSNPIVTILLSKKFNLQRLVEFAK